MLYGLVNTHPASSQVRRGSLSVAVDLGSIDARGLQRFCREAERSPVDMVTLNMLGTYDFYDVGLRYDGHSVRGFAAHTASHRPVTVAVDCVAGALPDPYGRPSGPAGTIGVVTDDATLWYPLISDGAGMLHPALDVARPVTEALWAETETFRRDKFRAVAVNCGPEVYNEVARELGAAADVEVVASVDLGARLAIGAGVVVVPSIEYKGVDDVFVVATRGTLGAGEFAHRIGNVGDARSAVPATAP
jgi:hypothetical protein